MALAAADVSRLYLGAASAHAASGCDADAAYVLEQLATLGRRCDPSLLFGVLRASKNPAKLWDAALSLLPGPIHPREYTPLVRQLVRNGHVGRATLLLSAAIRSFWHGGPEASAPSRALVHNVMVEMKIVRRVLVKHTPGALKPCPELFQEYAEALLAFGELLSENYLPLVADDKESLAWLIKHLYSFHEVASEWHSAVPDAPVLDVLHRSAVILALVIDRLPDGAPAPKTASRQVRADRQRYFCQPYGEQTYSALVHYTLTHADKPSWCRHVLEHMARIRSPPLALSRVTVNTLVQQATRRRLGDLAKYALELDPLHRHPSRQESTAQARLLARLDEAIDAGDTFRLAALLQYIATQRLHRSSEGALKATSVIYRVYPELRLLTSWRSSQEMQPPSSSSSSLSSSSSSSQPQSPSAAVYHPRVLTAALHVTMVAGNVPLALRVWSILKLAAHQSVVHRPWHVPIQAATLLFDLLGRCARKRAPGSTRAAEIALQEYEWLLEHWAHAPQKLDSRFFHALLRVLRTDSHARALTLRIRRDMAELDIA
ncbi:hypothetical protein MCUN1_002151 [Malassezia cuniculi]|uniref:Uncharacterized protein n=1 Tax=Malassezia cuniculi TaxID=948313 RepID=A0AAF0EUI5_9BASI|nr:hypothetical protein MCUN1_002151 [Malassezia cuniculi]